jgi:nitric oxide reductase subunit B
VLSDAQVAAWDAVRTHYTRMYSEPGYTDLNAVERINDPQEVSDLAAFFFWGGWLSAANRPDCDYSYTHNWPYDPEAGNTPTAEVLIWSTVSIFILFLGLMTTLFVYGQFQEEDDNDRQSLTTEDLENDIVRPTQPECYKFFVLAMVAFVIQTFAGIACAIDFVRPMGITVCGIIPFTVFRSYHTVFQIYWFFVSWVGATIFFLPRFSKIPVGQEFLIELLYKGCALVAAGGVFGIPLGQMGILKDDMAYYFGSQGWEYMELGRVFQDLLLAGFVLWIAILFRGVSPHLTSQRMWSPPAWLFYGSMVMVAFLFFSLKVTPKTNFVISDFWRWMVVHMWVEVTFEVFTTVIVSFLLTEMGLITRKAAERSTFIAVMLFFLTATIGIGHNFYWIAKPTGVIALGSAFSTTQVLPLILLTLEAWKNMQERLKAESEQKKGKQTYVMREVWLFLLGINFWNVFGAGVMGSLVNLPIVNYFLHSTYITGAHAHGAMFGVKGNVALASILYCAQHMLKKEDWSPALLRTSFWCLNGGMAMMMFMDLFPTGLYQLYIVMKYSFWQARSYELTNGVVFQFLAKMRAAGGHVFVWGGLLPLAYFIFSRSLSLKPVTKDKNKRGYTSWWHVEDQGDKVHAQ